MSGILDCFSSLFKPWPSSTPAPVTTIGAVPKTDHVPAASLPSVHPDLEEMYKKAKIKPEALTELNRRAGKIQAYEARYKFIEDQTGVPWFIVASIHNQEMGSDLGVFKAVLHNGERIVGTGRKTTLVPKGKGPFDTWEIAAIDALGGVGSHRKESWSLGHCLDWLERYNGLGYRNRGIPSPYLWAMTDQYAKGHYVADGVFDPNAVSKNTGCVALLKILGVFDNG